MFNVKGLDTDIVQCAEPQKGCGGVITKFVSNTCVRGSSLEKGSNTVIVDCTLPDSKKTILW